MIVQGFHETISRSRILRRTAADAGDADRMPLPRGFGEDLLDPDVVEPGAVDIVFIHEALVDSKVEGAECKVMTTGLKADAARLGYAVLAAANDKAVQVIVAPAHAQLDDVVQVRYRGFGCNENPAPDGRADAAKVDAQLVCRHWMPPAIDGRSSVASVSACPRFEPVSVPYGSSKTCVCSDYRR